jgi:prolipoprotein diacylglyceryltransferase
VAAVTEPGALDSITRMLASDQFQKQAKRAGRTVTWWFQLLCATFLGGFLVLLAVLIWVADIDRRLAVLVFVVSVAILSYGLLRACVGRFRDLQCPTCAVRGVVRKAQDGSYVFSCSQCGQSAETGVVDGGRYAT